MRVDAVRQVLGRPTKKITVLPASRITWMASQVVDGVWLTNRVSSTPRTR